MGEPLDAPVFSALKPLGRVARLANFRPVGTEPPAIATEDHRAVLVAAWAARQQGLFGDDSPLLVRLDAHPDLGEKPRPWAWEQSLLRTVEDVLAVANMQRPDDGGWACSAMQFGLSRGVATFFLHDYHRFPGDDGDYTTHDGRDCELWSFASIAQFLRRESRKAARLHAAIERGPVWLDIDLDFATTRDADGRPLPWTEEDWRAAFPPGARAWLAEVVERAALVTIASEPEFCGGWRGVARVVDGLRKVSPAGSGIAESL